MIHPAQVRAVRRAALTAGILGGTIAAHQAATGHTRLLPVAVPLWVGLVAVAALVGGRTASVPTRLPLLTAMVCAGQAAAHLLLGVAPWMLGLDMPAGAAVGAAALTTHGVATVLITLLLAGFDAMVAVAADVVRRLTGCAPRAAVPPPAPRRMPTTPRRPAGAVARAVHSTRGPPAPLAV